MALSATLADVDFDLLQATWLSASQPADDHPSVDRAALAQAPSRVVRQPVSAADHQAWALARSLGEQAISAGTVAVITVAGGQGTRLGFEHPKGLFPIGPVTDRTLFQIFAEQILARRRRHRADLPWCIMTSDATHEETVAFFQQHQYFGLTPDSLHFFRQGSLPAMDAATGQLLLAAPGQLALSPDGHGGLVTALARAGLLELLQAGGERVAPPCPAFGQCGGCEWQHLPYERQWQAKKSGVLHALKRVEVQSEALPWDNFPAELIWEYRNRVQLRGFRDQIGFYARGSNSLVPIEKCWIARPELNARIPAAREAGMSRPREYKLELEVFPNGCTAALRASIQLLTPTHLIAS